MTAWNIDVDPPLFDELVRHFEEVIDEPGRVLVLHRRKSGPVDQDRRENVLGLVKTSMERFVREPFDVDMLHLLDCGSAENDGVHTDLSLLGAIMGQLADGLGPEVPADLALLDHEIEPSEKGGPSLADVRMRSLRDPSVIEDSLDHALKVIDGIDVNPESVILAKHDIDRIVRDVMERFEGNLP